MQQNRRSILTAITLAASMALLAACGGGGGAASGKNAITTDDVVFGNENAPVTVVEYASLACPGCAAFNNNYFAEFKKKYIDSGQIKFVQREMTTHNAPLSATAFLLARCAGHDKFLTVADAVYHADSEMEQTGDFRGGLLKIAKSVGTSEAQFDTCTQDAKAIEAFNARVDKNVNEHDIHSTPTFVINGKLLETPTVPTLADLDKAITDAKAAPAAPAAPKS